MTQPSFKDAITICKSIMRNGFDAHIVNTPLHHLLIVADSKQEIDLCTDMPGEDLVKLFPAAALEAEENGALATLREGDFLYRFYPMHENTVAPEDFLTRTTPTLEARLALYKDAETVKRQNMKHKEYKGFMCMEHSVCFAGHPDEVLRQDYLRGIQAMRHAANFDLPIEQNTWMAIVGSSQRIIDYISVQHIMDEWRQVAAENMWRFVQLLFESQVLHALIPELAALACVQQTKNDSGVMDSVLEHTIGCMRHYPEGEFNHDWLGTLAVLFHDVGKLYTAEFYQGRWTFYQHHRVGAQVTRIILRRLRMPIDQIDLVCELVCNHMRFQFTMTDRGIRRFTRLESYQRLIQMSRANIKSREDNYTAFNHNTKYLDRAEKPERELEPLLNGNQIMEVTGLQPSPHVGLLRQNLLKAQITGEVNTLEDATAFVKLHAQSV